MKQKRDFIFALILWGMLTAVGEVWAFTTDFFPMAASEEALLIDDAFRLLTILGVPVATAVLAFLGYSFVRFRNREESTEDGAPIKTSRPITVGWFVVTTALAVFVVFNPGLKGMEELAARENADLVIEVEGEQWHWNVTYPQHDLSYERALQIAVPVDTPVRFEITTKDVIHSLWIPAFHMKMDALPGRITTLHVTPMETGSFDADPNFRVQCAELCGTGHARMQMAVRVLEPEEFEHWLAEAREMTGGMEMDMEGMDMDMNGDDMDMDSDGDMDMDSDGDMDMGDEHDEEMDMDNMDEEHDDGMDMDSDS